MAIYSCDIEEWKPVKGFEFYYEISNQGRLKKLPRMKYGRNKHGQFSFMMPERITTGYDSDGYRWYELYDTDNKRHCKKIHRLVAEAFLLNPDNKPEVNHRNGIKHDNVVINLEWTTTKENIRHAWDIGLNTSKRGEEHSQSVLTTEEVIEIRELKDGGYTYKELAKLFDCHADTVRKVVKGILWSHVEEGLA
jgi:hypothetical protein